jgi:hypothetical protein
MKELTRPFPPRLIHKNPSGAGEYVRHHVVEQRLIQVLGIPPDFEKVEVIYGDVTEIAPNPQGSSKRAKEGRPALKQVIVAVICRMTVLLPTGRVVVEEAGDCEEPHNWSTDGQRLKDAMSDAYKRCAMRIGCGLHLWSRDEYFLFDKFDALKVSGVSGNASGGSAAPSGDDASVTGAGEASSPSPAPQVDSWEQPEVAGGTTNAPEGDSSGEASSGAPSAKASPPQSSEGPGATKPGLTGSSRDDLASLIDECVTAELKVGRSNLTEAYMVTKYNRLASDMGFPAAVADGDQSDYDVMLDKGETDVLDAIVVTLKLRERVEGVPA